MKKLAIQDNGDFGFICLAAMRYALGRQTYTPGIICDFLKLNWPLIDESDRATIRRDLDLAINMDAGHPEAMYLGNNDDRKMWLEFRARIKE